MKYYFPHIKAFFYRFLILLALFELSRIFFFILNYNYFSDISFFESIKVLYFGLQYDVYVILAFNFPFIFMSLMPGNFKNRKSYQLSLKILYTVINSLLILVNFIDSEYFRFNFKRSTSDILDFLNAGGGETGNLLPEFLKGFWYILLIWIGLIVATWYLYPKLKAIPEEPNKSSLKRRLSLSGMQTLIMLGVFAVLITISRGLRVQPLNILSSAKYVEVKYIPLVLNTPFTIIRTINKADLERVKYFNNGEEYKYFNPLTEYNNTGEFKYHNVVIIILESFSQEYVSYITKSKGYTPFLDSLLSKSLVFTNGFANGKRSIEALPAIFSGIPSLMSNSYVSSQFSVNKISSLASVLKEKGYHTSFFHGGNNGTMGFDDFVKIAGFEEYYGSNEYPEKDRDFDGNWGIFDEEYLQYFCDKLSSFKQPFFSSVFTLSSHHPYTVPDRYEDKFKEGPVNITRVIEYSDFALEKFFEKASKTDWFKNTLFVLVADHTGQAIKPEYYKQMGNFRIPIAFFHPADSLLKGKRTEIAQQCDIAPSVLDYLNYNGRFLCFGNSVFNAKSPKFALQYINEYYQMQKDGYMITFDGENCLALWSIDDYNLDNNLMNEKTAIKDKMETFLKAVIQVYNTRMLDNKMVPDSK